MYQYWLFLFFQIVIESLPVSSSGHVYLLSSVLALDWGGKLFGALDYASHAITVLVIMTVFFNAWSVPLKRLFACCVHSDSYKKLWRVFGKIIGLTVIADLITTGFYVIIKGVLSDVIVSAVPVLVVGGCVVTGMALLSLRLIDERRAYEPWDVSKAIALGILQGMSLLPAVSRFGVTYVGARWLRMSPRRAIEVSFLIQFPLILAGSIKGICALIHMNMLPIFVSWTTGGVLVMSFVFAVFLLHTMCAWATRKKLWRIGWYMVLPFLISMYLVISQ